MFNALIGLLLTSSLVQRSAAARKKWVGGAQWDEDAYWTPRGVPGSCDRALLEGNQILHADGRSAVAEISFAGDSSIVFDSFTELSFGDTGQLELCNSVSPTLKRYSAERENFLDVNNWQAYEEFGELSTVDIHRIPCQNDIIELPRGLVRAELLRPVRVGKVSYGEEILSRDQLDDWLQSPTGRNEIRMLDSFTMTGDLYCRGEGGYCECGNEASCNQTTCPPISHCFSPIISRVMCCPLCGTEVRVPINPTVPYRQLQMEFSTLLSELPFPQLVSMGNSNGELYLVLEESVRKDSRKVAQLLIEKMRERNYAPSESFMVQSSSVVEAATAAPKKDEEEGPNGAAHTNNILLITLACVTLCLIVCGVVLVYTVRRGRIRFLPMEGASAAENTYETPQHIYETVDRKGGSTDYYSTIPSYVKSPVPSLSPSSLSPSVADELMICTGLSSPPPSSEHSLLSRQTSV